MSKTTIWVSRDKTGYFSNTAFFWPERPAVDDGGDYGDGTLSPLYSLDVRKTGAAALALPAPGELLRVEVSAEVVERIQGD